MNNIKDRKRILIIENSSLDFYKARLSLSKYLLDRGLIVYALIPNGEYVDLIQKEGIVVIGYDLNRKDKGLGQLFRLIWIYRKVIKEYNIDIVHSFRFQPNLLNVLANLFNRRIIVLHITGLGIAFSNSSASYLTLRLLSQIIFQLKLFRANKLIVQNIDDAKDIWFEKYWRKKLYLIEGSGVDTFYFDTTFFSKADLRRSLEIKTDDIVFICITRLIWEKGIKELVDGFRIVQQSHKNVKLWIVGWPDKDNPRHVDDSYIRQFDLNSNISFLGKRNDVRELLAASDVFIYPSYYREGIPRGILEALSMRLPVITTDMPGCKMTVVHNENGYLIPIRSSTAISDVVHEIINHKDLSEMGRRSRVLAEKKFSCAVIFLKIYNLYEEQLSLYIDSGRKYL